MNTSCNLFCFQHDFPLNYHYSADGFASVFVNSMISSSICTLFVPIYILICLFKALNFVPSFCLSLVEVLVFRILLLFIAMMIVRACGWLVILLASKYQWHFLCKKIHLFENLIFSSEIPRVPEWFFWSIP
ncbi:hypothetical protein IC582_011497 [Cucumis melo]